MVSRSLWSQVFHIRCWAATSCFDLFTCCVYLISSLPCWSLTAVLLSTWQTMASCCKEHGGWLTWKTRLPHISRVFYSDSVMSKWVSELRGSLVGRQASLIVPALLHWGPPSPIRSHANSRWETTRFPLILKTGPSVVLQSAPWSACDAASCHLHRHSNALVTFRVGFNRNTRVSGKKWAQLVSWTTSKMWKERSVLIEQDSESMYCKKKEQYKYQGQLPSPTFLGVGFYSVLSCSYLVSSQHSAYTVHDITQHYIKHIYNTENTIR